MSPAARHRRRLGPRLSALRDHDLGPLRAALLRRHLRRCAECQQVMRELDDQVAALGRLGQGAEQPAPAEAGSEPAPGLPDLNLDEGWRALSAKLPRSPAAPLPRRPEAGPGGRGRGFWVERRALVLGAACMGLGLLGVLRLHPDGLFRRPPSDDVIISLAEEEFRQAEAHYQRALEQLLRVSAQAQKGWTEREVQAYKEGLRSLQRSTDHYRERARARPADAEVQAGLYAAYRRQISYVQDILLVGPSSQRQNVPWTGRADGPSGGEEASP